MRTWLYLNDGYRILKILVARQGDAIFHMPAAGGITASPAPRTLGRVAFFPALTLYETKEDPVDGWATGLPWRHRGVLALPTGSGNGKVSKVSSKVSRRNSLKIKRNS